MKNVLLIVVSISLFISCDNKADKRNVEEISKVEQCKDSLNTTLNEVLHEWLSYYNLDFKQFKEIDKIEFDLESLEDESNLYYKKMTEIDVNYLPQIRDYSSDNRYSLNVLESAEIYQKKDSVWYFSGLEENQRVFLCDRIDSSLMLVSYRGLNNLIDAGFWIDNQNFMLVGVDRREKDFVKYLVEVYNINNKQMVTYALNDSISQIDSLYLTGINMKNRGVIFE